MVQLLIGMYNIATFSYSDTLESFRHYDDEISE